MASPALLEIKCMVMVQGAREPWKPKHGLTIARLAASVTRDPAFCCFEESARLLEMLWGRPRVLGCMLKEYSIR
jgi:hypothetical protein